MQKGWKGAGYKSIHCLAMEKLRMVSKPQQQCFAKDQCHDLNVVEAKSDFQAASGIY